MPRDACLELYLRPCGVAWHAGLHADSDPKIRIKGLKCQKLLKLPRQCFKYSTVNLCGILYFSCTQTCCHQKDCNCWNYCPWKFNLPAFVHSHRPPPTQQSACVWSSLRHRSIYGFVYVYKPVMCSRIVFPCWLFTKQLDLKCIFTFFYQLMSSWFRGEDYLYALRHQSEAPSLDLWRTVIKFA